MHLPVNQLECFLFRQSHWLLSSATQDRSFIAWCMTCPLISRSLINQLPQDNDIRLEAPLTTSSHGTMCSKKYTLHWELDHRTRSSLRMVMTSLCLPSIHPVWPLVKIFVILVGRTPTMGAAVAQLVEEAVH